MSDVTIEPVSEPFAATISPPGSKSLTNRALVVAALANGASALSNVLFADDTEVMLENLSRLGFELKIDRQACSVEVKGRAGIIASGAAELFCGNSGTTIRFLAALCSLGHGEFVLDGNARMRQRPIGELLELLRNMGGRVNCLEKEGFAPLKVMGHGLAGGILAFGAAKSSQFLSAILMISPQTRHEVSVDLASGQTSWPYVEMTMRLMDEFGVTCELIRDPVSSEPRRIVVPQGNYTARDYAIEPDASNASYFMAVAAIHAGAKVVIKGLGKHSLQGDVNFAGVLKQMGAEVVMGGDSITVTGTDQLEGIDVDLSGMPDTAQTLAVAALFAEGATTIRGLHTLRVKETDRLAALSAELSKLGAKVDVKTDAITIVPPSSPSVARAAAIETYDDHRMAMSFALAGTKVAGVVIKDAGCVAKTYPNYFDDLRRVLGSKN